MDVETLGQVFTPDNIVDRMLSLRKNDGSVLEPSAGTGQFLRKIPGAYGIEVDSNIAPEGCRCLDFFDFPTEMKFDTIIGNPPYVAYKSVNPKTKRLLPSRFDQRTNLYVFFIDKCLDHLSDHGEIIFITPRDFLKATSARILNEKLHSLGTITDVIDLGDQSVFPGYTPNCIIWRFEKGDFSRSTSVNDLQKRFVLHEGQIVFLKENYTIRFKDVFSVKVGAVSGLDAVFANEHLGNTDFVYSKTVSTGKTRRMVVASEDSVIRGYLTYWYEWLVDRKIRKFDRRNYWQWGRWQYDSDRERIYVNCKTRVRRPFFTNPCKNYDGSVLAIFPHAKIAYADCEVVADMLNEVNWNDMGFVCGGRFLFGQRSLESALLPDVFRQLLA